MFRDRTIFKALLDDFSASLLTWDPWFNKTPNYRHQDVFSSTKSSNPGSVQSMGRDSASLHAHMCVSFSLLRCVLAASPAVPGQGYTPGHGAKVPFPVLTRLSAGTEPSLEPAGLCKDPQQMPNPPWAAASAALPGLPAEPGSLSCSFPLPSLALYTASASLKFWSFCFSKASPVTPGNILSPWKVLLCLSPQNESLCSLTDVPPLRCS